MSFHCDYYASSNNSINENTINSKKARSSSHQIKKLIKPLLSVLRKHKKNTYKKSPQPEFYNDECEINDNNANELLEQQIFEEIDSCDFDSAVPVYRNGHMDIIPVFRGQNYIPVHFAKTEAGTFFWTSMVGADCDISNVGDKNAISNQQTAELQVPCDRWAQA